jgi:hypothetical protein
MKDKYAVTFSNNNGSSDSLFFPTLKQSKRCKTSLSKDWKVVYIEKKTNGIYKKITN